MKYIIGIDQSTQGTKAVLFDQNAALVCRTDLPHRQIVSENGWVSHDMEEVYQSTLQVVENLLKKAAIAPDSIAAIGISNQRETTVAWDRATGKPICHAIVWQCARAADCCKDFTEEGLEYIRTATGIPLSPYFPAAKMKWILKNVPAARELAAQGQLCMGTVDSCLLFRLTGGKVFATDYSNASRTQLLNLHSLTWDEKIVDSFGIPMDALPQICFSDSLFGESDLGGLFSAPIPIHAMLGDSHAALFGHGCLEKGGVKTTYGTGSSIMMNIGPEFAASRHGLVTSLAWGYKGQVSYVLEGNLNYTGAVITWLKDDLQLISSAAETEALARAANPADAAYLVPAFSGLGAPYWNSAARATLWGMTRSTGKKEIVRAALDCIAYQITDILEAMEADCGTPIAKLCVDGGPTRNGYLMQFQADMARIPLAVPSSEELSAMGAAYMAGIALGLYEETIFSGLQYTAYGPEMAEAVRNEKYSGWKAAVNTVIKE